MKCSPNDSCRYLTYFTCDNAFLLTVSEKLEDVQKANYSKLELAEMTNQVIQPELNLELTNAQTFVFVTY